MNPVHTLLLVAFKPPPMLSLHIVPMQTYNNM